MKIVSMVPSWTETLLECGIEVVGRTRFCIHPQERVKAIPVVGGTKDVDWDKVRASGADLLLLDREENPKSFADEAPMPVLATHVTRVHDLPREIEKIVSATSSARLRELAERWRAVATPAREMKSWSEFPAVIQWLKKPEDGVHPLRESSFCYVIWRKPWMCVRQDTFIASMLEASGVTARCWPPAVGGESAAAAKYPQFSLEDLPENCVLLFSSEPYPFHRKAKELLEIPFPAAIVDGESFSWFGLRSLRFLERLRASK